MDSVRDGESSCAEALRNSLILQKIFTYCPTSLLLSSCSLVNKFWNREARTLIRDNRLCMAYMPTTDFCCNSRCTKIQELDELCVQMAEQGRQIPWNGLHMSTPCYKHVIPCGSGPAMLKSKLKIAQLEIYWSYRDFYLAVECLFHKPVTSFFRHCASELRKLKVSDLPPGFYDGIIRSSNIAGFPKLEEVEIVNSRWDPERLKRQKVALSKILAAAPKMRRISAHDVWSLKIIPEDKLGMLVKMKFKFSVWPEPEPFHNILNAKPTLTDLSILQPEDEYPAENQDAFDAFGRILAQLLQLGEHSLRNISIHGIYPIGPFTFPSVMHSLRKLTITNQVGDKIVNANDIWNTFTSMDLNHRAPRLNTVEFIIRDFDPDHQDPRSCIWPFDDRDSNKNTPSYSNVRELVLDVAASEINFESVHLLFPKLTSLELRKKDCSALSFITLPLPQTFKFWPELNSLKITLLNEQVKARTFEIAISEFQKPCVVP